MIYIHLYRLMFLSIILSISILLSTMLHTIVWEDLAKSAAQASFDDRVDKPSGKR